ncbi:hypothetical protein PVAP13_3NG056568 [Panicum virgatum]|uniref:Uncharacterized protein n=1 Tax=Panicum virgatum TaxID=38727 RepID=A0A8T0U0L2_PANVG|nr:hypothetical protein PVAP13_3NG056568 [Panicum virgatum]
MVNDARRQVALSYTHFCRPRSLAPEGQKHHEVCDICYQRHRQILSFNKEKLQGHCIGLHHHPGFLCENQGCFRRVWMEVVKIFSL